MAATSVPKLYRSVIEDVVNNVREAFLDEGVDEQVLVELKQIWEKKLAESKAIEHREPENVPMSRVVLHGSQQQHHPQQQQAASQITSSAIAHQLTLPPSHLVQQALLQYAQQQQEGVRGDGQKTVTLTMPQKLTITLPAHMTQAGLQAVMSGPAAAATLALPPELTASLLQQAALNQGGTLNNPMHAGDRSVQYQAVTVNHPQQQQQQQTSHANSIIQLDGNHDDTSDDEDEEEDDGNAEDENDEEDFLDEEEVDPLNSEDDVSDDDPTELFDTDNVVVCQYDKITRSRNRWKFHLKDGIMNLQGKDYAFQKAVGDAEW